MKNQERKLEETKDYNKSEKGRAAQALRDAVRRGDIERQPCEICQEPQAQGHHFDYSKPLDVRWLCPQHHREEHLFEPWQNEMRRAGYTGGFLLGQLIEACGEGFGGILRTIDNWNAETEEIETKFEAFSSEYAPHQIMFQSGVSYTAYSGSTPEEAVARLWLALNK